MSDAAKPVVEIDGNEFSTLEEFFDVVSQTLVQGATWGRNLNAFNDILRGGLGTPEGGFILVWKNSAASRERLGYAETIRCLGLPITRASYSAELDDARRGIGPTVFDWLVEIIRSHGPGGGESEDGVELVLA